MKPDFLSCKTCLYCKNITSADVVECTEGNVGVIPHFCSKWRCRRCFGGVAAWANDLTGFTQITNHYACQEVQLIDPKDWMEINHD